MNAFRQNGRTFASISPLFIFTLIIAVGVYLAPRSIIAFAFRRRYRFHSPKEEDTCARKRQCESYIPLAKEIDKYTQNIRMIYVLRSKVSTSNNTKGCKDANCIFFRFLLGRTFVDSCCRRRGNYHKFATPRDSPHACSTYMYVEHAKYDSSDCF